MLAFGVWEGVSARPWVRGVAVKRLHAQLSCGHTYVCARHFYTNSLTIYLYIHIDMYICMFVLSWLCSFFRDPSGVVICVLCACRRREVDRLWPAYYYSDPFGDLIRRNFSEEKVEGNDRNRACKQNVVLCTQPWNVLSDNIHWVRNQFAVLHAHATSETTAHSKALRLSAYPIYASNEHNVPRIPVVAAHTHLYQFPFLPASFRLLSATLPFKTATANNVGKAAAMRLIWLCLFALVSLLKYSMLRFM